MSPTSSLVCKSFPKTLLAASDPAHTGRVAAQHSAKNGTFSIICTVLCCCTMREHPPWQQLFPFVADVTLHLTRSVWTRGNSTLTSTCSRSWMWGGGINRQFQQRYIMSYANAYLTEMTLALSWKLMQLPYAKARTGPLTP